MVHVKVNYETELLLKVYWIGSLVVGLRRMFLKSSSGCCHQR